MIASVVQDPENAKLENTVGADDGDDEGIGDQGGGPTAELHALVSCEEAEGVMRMSSSELKQHPSRVSSESDSERLDVTGERHPLVPRVASPKGRLVRDREWPGAKNITAIVNGHRRVEDAAFAHPLAGGSCALAAGMASSLKSMDEERRILELDRLDAALISLRTGNPIFNSSTREVLI